MKVLKSLVAMAVAVLTLTACSGGGEKQAETTGTESAQEPTELKLDVERIVSYKDKDASEMTESDYDFLLDQYEIMAEQAEGMSSEEYRTYLNQLSENEQGAVILLGFAIMAADNSGKFTESQAARFKEIENKAPKQ